MKGDFSRNTFNKKKHFASVRMQQGRVQLDADWNEQMDIIDNRIRIGSQDFIGGSGAPSGSPGYSITPTTAKTDLTISAGRFYIQGVLVENEKAITYTEQTLPDADTLSEFTSNGLYLAYLDSWQQGVSAVDDPSIEEPAFKGADTATRIKNVAQVKLKKLTTEYSGINLTCEKVINADTANKAIWDGIKSPANIGKLSARLSKNANLENQLYRIEIHESGDQSKATFKWSRNNGALVVGIKSIDNNNSITLKSNVNKELNFSASQWVELSTRTRELQNKPGIFIQLLKVEDNILTLARALTTAEQTEFKVNGTVRQWDSVKTFVAKSNTADLLSVTNLKKVGNDTSLDLPSANDASKFTVGEFVELRKVKTELGVFARLKAKNNKTLTLEIGYSFANLSKYIRPSGAAATVANSTDQFIALENGLEIKFETGNYKTGDYWLLPTRAITNSIVSAQYGNFSTAQLPEGIQHYYAQLALVRRKTDNTWELAGDCRNIISALANQAYQSASGTRTPSNSVYVAQDGKVGIGNNIPKSKLDVEGNVAIGSTYSGTNTAPTDGLIVEGNVGIGTDSPSAKLEVNGGVKLIGVGKVSIDTETASNAEKNVEINGNVIIGKTIDGTLVNRNFLVQGSTRTTNLEVTAITTLSGNTTTGGNVTVGTSTAPRNLTVTGTTALTSLTVTGNTTTAGISPSQISILSLNSQFLHVSSAAIGMGIAASDLYYKSNGSHKWYIDAGAVVGVSGKTPKMTLNSTGLGIGTDSPSAKLEVNGGVKLIGVGKVSIDTETASNAEKNVEINGNVIIGKTIDGTLVNRNFLVQGSTRTTNLEVTAITTLSGNTTTGGNVTVGTSTAPRNLTVTGTTALTSLTVTGNTTTAGISPSQISILSLNSQFLHVSSAAIGMGIAASDLYYKSNGSHKWYIDTGAVVGVSGKTPKMTLNSTGLGIGTDSPSAKLEVNGGVKLIGVGKVSIDTETASNAEKNVEINGNVIIGKTIDGTLVNRNFVVQGSTRTTNLEVTAITTLSGNTTTGGNVTVGTSTAPRNLTVTGTTALTSLTVTGNTTTAGISPSQISILSLNSQFLHVSSAAIGMGIAASDLYYKSNGSHKWYIDAGTVVGVSGKTPKMTLNSTGLGIGTDNPTHPLTVDTGISQTRNHYRIFDSAGARNETNSQTKLESIYSKNSIFILSGGLLSSSDERIKEIVSTNETKQDLELLNQLNVTDYRYKDKVACGNNVKKGLIAQEVEKICPDAVQQRQQFIPDIYQLSTAVDINQVEKTAQITLAAEHHLNVGDKVKLINEKLEFIKTVKAISDAKSFVVADWKEADKKIFVYGKEVDDFRSLDYSQIFCLNISATQGLYKEVCALTRRLQQQEQEIYTQNKKLQLQTEQIQLLNKKLDQLLTKK